MNSYPDAIEEAILFLKQLPGVGKRGAERMVLAMLEWEKEDISAFSSVIKRVAQEITPCPECGNCAENGALCAIWSDSRRDIAQLCVVESVSQLLAVEKGGSYRGRYLVLGGKLSPLDGENGENLNFDLLLRRAALPEVKEVNSSISLR